MQLTRLSLERDMLEAEYARMSLGSGRSAAERRRKVDVEGRLSDLGSELNGLRKQLRAAA